MKILENIIEFLNSILKLISDFINSINFDYLIIGVLLYCSVSIIFILIEKKN